MIPKLTPNQEQLEQLLTKIKDPVVRTSEQLDQLEPTHPQYQQAAAQFLDLSLDNNKKVQDKIRQTSSWRDDRLEKSLNAVIPEAKQVFAQAYFSQKLQEALASPKEVGTLQKLAKETSLEDTLTPLLASYVQDVKAEFTQGNINYTTEQLSTLLDIGEAAQNKQDILEIVKQYVGEKIEQVREPKERSDFSIRGTYELAQKAGLRDEDLDLLYVATGLLDQSHRGWSSDSNLQLNDDNRQEALKLAWDLGTSLLENNPNISPVFLRKVIHNKTFQENLPSDPRLRDIAKHVIARDISHFDVDDIQEIKELQKTYGVSHIKRPLSKGIVNQLEKGNVQNAYAFAQAFGYEIQPRHFAQAKRRVINEQHKTVQVDLEKALGYQKRINFLDFLEENGGLNPTALPTVNFDDSYRGKITLAQLGEKTFVWGHGGYHADILDSLNKELSHIGFGSRAAREQGGAHISFDSEKKTCTIYDKSVAFGECDKTLAQKLVQEEFPNYEVIAEPYSRW